MLPQRIPQVVLGRGPVLRQLLAGIHLQGVAVGGHRLLQMLLGSFSLYTNAKFQVRFSNVTEHRRPQKRLPFPGNIAQRPLITRQRLIKIIIVVSRISGQPEIPDGFFGQRLFLLPHGFQAFGLGVTRFLEQVMRFAKFLLGKSGQTEFGEIVLILLHVGDPFVDFRPGFLRTETVLGRPVLDIPAEIDVLRTAFRPHLLPGLLRHVLDEFLNPIVRPEFPGADRQQPDFHLFLFQVSGNAGFSLQRVLNAPVRLIHQQRDFLSGLVHIRQKQPKQPLCLGADRIPPFLERNLDAFFHRDGFVMLFDQHHLTLEQALFGQQQRRQQQQNSQDDRITLLHFFLLKVKLICVFPSVVYCSEV